MAERDPQVEAVLGARVDSLVTLAGQVRPVAYAAMRLLRAWVKAIERLMYSRYSSTLAAGTAFPEKSSKS